MAHGKLANTMLTRPVGLTGLAGTLAAAPSLAAEEGGKGGLPQLDFATWPTQLFWLAVTFGLAYLLMWRVVTPAIGSVLEERHARINDDMERAKNAAEEAVQMRVDLEARLAEARSVAVENTRKTLADAQAEADKRKAEISKRLATKVGKAEAAVKEAREAALKEIDGVASQGAVDAVLSIAGIKVTKADAAKAVKAAAKARPAAMEGN